MENYLKMQGCIVDENHLVENVHAVETSLCIVVEILGFIYLLSKNKTSKN